MKKNRFYDLFDLIKEMENPLQADVFFEAMKDAYGLENILYNHVNGAIRNKDNCFLVGLYPPAWIDHYFQSGYFQHDPVAQLGMTRKSPFDWGEIPKETREARKIFAEWNDNGYGNQGLTIPLTSPAGETATLNLSSNMSDADWQALKPYLLHDLSILGELYHHSASHKMEQVGQIEALRLSDRELECLKWAASGKSIWETSVILNIAERNVRYHLDQARRKLRCTTKIQAVARAVALGLINVS